MSLVAVICIATTVVVMPTDISPENVRFVDSAEIVPGAELAGGRRRPRRMVALRVTGIQAGTIEREVRTWAMTEEQAVWIGQALLREAHQL